MAVGITPEIEFIIAIIHVTTLSTFALRMHPEVILMRFLYYG